MIKQVHSQAQCHVSLSSWICSKQRIKRVKKQTNGNLTKHNLPHGCFNFKIAAANCMAAALIASDSRGFSTDTEKPQQGHCALEEEGSTKALHSFFLLIEKVLCAHRKFIVYFQIPAVIGNRIEQTHLYQKMSR